MKLLCTNGEAAGVLDVSERQVERLVASGTLPSVLIGRARRIRMADLQTFVAGVVIRRQTLLIASPPHRRTLLTCNG